MKLVFWLGLVALPIVSVVLDWPLALVAALVILLLTIRWFSVLASLARKQQAPELCLETIAASHFCEKVRWCMDRLGLEYIQQVWAGTLGAFFKGRLVPTLHIRGAGSIENSSDILRYLWGRYGESTGDGAEFLRPTEQRVRWETRLDRYGVDLQRWCYFHLLPDRSATLRAWGCADPRVPAWQKAAIRLLFPIHRVLLRRAFRISPAGYTRSRERIEALLGECEQILAESEGGLTGESVDYADLTLASLSGLWLQPPEYAAGQAEHIRLDDAVLPEGWRADREAWRQAYPATCSFVERLYREQRR